MLRSTRSVLVVTTAVAAAACASTSFPPRWKNPAAEPGNFKGQQGAAVAMRVLGKDQQISQSSGGMYWGGPAYATFWGAGYYGYGWGGVYSPGYIQTGTIVIVETPVYSLPQSQVVWGAPSRTTD